VGIIGAEREIVSSHPKLCLEFEGVLKGPSLERNAGFCEMPVIFGFRHKINLSR
jgi:hypothetical protein